MGANFPEGCIVSCRAVCQDVCARRFGGGGLVGSNSGCVIGSAALGGILAPDSSQAQGGLAGGNVDGDVKMSFWDRETSGLAESAGGEGLTTAQMQQATPFLEAGWDFVDERANGITDAWRMPEGGGNPVLTLGFDGDNPPRLGGEGTAVAPYRIGTPEDLGIMWRHDPFACYQLVTRCYATGRLTAGRRSVALGGLIGRNQGSVADCYTRTGLSCGEESSHVGGLVGYDKGAIQRSYAAGAVVAADPNATCGGLLGTTATTLTKVMMIACYFLDASEGAGPNNGLGVPLTGAHLKQQTSFLNWDFKNTWKICAGKDYPRLWWETIDCDRP